MSWTRISNAPGPASWRDDGPQQAVAHAKPYSAVHADNVGDMRPVLSAGGNAYEWQGRRKAYSITGHGKPVCGVPLHKKHHWKDLSGETCARAVGHTSRDHSSAATMAREAANRHP